MAAAKFVSHTADTCYGRLFLTGPLDGRVYALGMWGEMHLCNSYFLATLKINVAGSFPDSEVLFFRRPTQNFPPERFKSGALDVKFGKILMLP